MVAKVCAVMEAVLGPWWDCSSFQWHTERKQNSHVKFIVNQAISAYTLKFAKYHFYRNGQQGAVFFCHMNGVPREVFQAKYKRDCSLLSLSVEMVLIELRRVSGDYLFSPFLFDRFFWYIYHVQFNWWWSTMIKLSLWSQIGHLILEIPSRKSQNLNVHQC